MLPYYDDRLSTVIAGPVPERALARVQYRQLLDLLAGAAPASTTLDNIGLSGIFSPEQMAAGLTRLHQLSNKMTMEQERDALRELHKPLTAPALLNYLLSKSATRDIALDKSPFTLDQWQSLRPLLGMKAKAYLQVRAIFASSDNENAIIENDAYFIGSKASCQAYADNDVLILDAAISKDDAQNTEINSNAITDAENTVETVSPQNKQSIAAQNISDLVARIESFTRTSSQPKLRNESAPLLPLEELDALQKTGTQLIFKTNEDGIITATSHSNLIGIKLFMAAEDAGWGCDHATSRRFLNRMAIRQGKVIVPGQMGGQKYIDAYPEFDEYGRYCGYAGIIFPDPEHHLAEQSVKTLENESRDDYYRQLIHELRTPVSALKGFAEILQSQLFGPVSKQYREMAEKILEDSALLLSHFDHLKHFEQKSQAALEQRPVKISDLGEQLKQAMLLAASKARIMVDLQADESLCIPHEIADALQFWLENQAIDTADNLSIAFINGKTSDRVYAIFENTRHPKNDRNNSKEADRRNFAISLANARLLDAGAKIESQSVKTIMDLPTMPVIKGV